MSGGVAYVLHESDESSFESKCNQDLVHLEQLTDPDEIEELFETIKTHIEHTYSDNAKRILRNWEEMVPKFVKVIPKDYRKIQNRIQELLNEGNDKHEAEMKAFEESKISVEALKN
jgi:glutamate synthase (NADPH) large chain